MSGPGAADLQRAGIQPPQTGTTNKGDPFKMMMDQLLTRFDQSDAKLIKVGSDVAGINENIRGMQNQIANNRNDIAAISEQVNDLKRSNKDEVANQVAAELRRAGVGAGASAEIDKLIQEKMRRVDKEIDKARAIAGASALRPRPASTSALDEGQAYWHARKCAWISPVPGSGSELWAGCAKFFYEKMRIPPSQLEHKHVIHVERVTAGRKSKIQDEALVVFSSVRVRDMVSSYASNLADWKNCVPPFNFRMEFPDHLAGVFRTLDNYGHVLKNRLGHSTKRNIKFDDVKKTLYMDICPHNEKEWLRVDYELAPEEMALVRPKTACARTMFGSLGSALTSEHSAPDSPAVFTSALSSPHWSNPPKGSSRATGDPNMETEDEPTPTPAAPTWSGPPQ